MFNLFSDKIEKRCVASGKLPEEKPKKPESKLYYDHNKEEFISEEEYMNPPKENYYRNPW